MRKILIADAGEGFAEALAELLRGAYLVRTCAEGNQTLEELKRMRPDILVLDLLLPGLDGITILQRTAEAGLEPMVLATTGFASDYVLEELDRLNVGYLMHKPCDLNAMVQRINDLRHRLKEPEITVPDLRSCVRNALLRLPVSTKLKGYPCILEAVMEKSRDPAQQVTKELYPKVAKTLGGNGTQVERLIRTAIAKAFEQRNEAVWARYFSPNRDGVWERPSNTEFITALAERVALDMKNGLVD